jgi:cytochrome c556
MTRMLLTAVAMTIGITAVAAQQSVIEARKALMKRSGEQARIGGQMARGEIPYDAAKAQAMYAAFEDKAQKLPTLFPANSKKGGETRALPAIWDKNDAFKAQIAKFDSDIKAAKAATKDLDSFKAGFASVTRNCASCHENFRRPQT